MHVLRQVRNDNFRLQRLQFWNRIIRDTIQQCTGQRDGGGNNELVGRVSLTLVTAGGLWVVCEDREGADEVVVIDAQGWILVEVT